MLVERSAGAGAGRVLMVQKVVFLIQINCLSRNELLSFEAYIFTRNTDNERRGPIESNALHLAMDTRSRAQPLIRW